MHNSSKWGFKHHGNTGAYSNNDHDPVQVSNQTQQVTVKKYIRISSTERLSTMSFVFCLYHS